VRGQAEYAKALNHDIADKIASGVPLEENALPDTTRQGRGRLRVRGREEGAAGTSNISLQGTGE